jgi:hypothetical protein
MVQIAVDVGGTQHFNALLYGQKHPGTLQSLQNQFAQYDQFSRTMTDAARGFFADAHEIYNRYNSEEALRLARLANQKVGSIFKPDCIRSIWELGEIQQAPFTMQRWIMAEPTVRALYHQQRCDGYSDTYIDMHPGQIGEDHYDYRRVINGVAMEVPEVDDEGEAGWKISLYAEDLLPEDRDLALDEQVAILSTWDIVRSYIEAGKDDPTSPFGNKL